MKAKYNYNQKKHQQIVIMAFYINSGKFQILLSWKSMCFGGQIIFVCFFLFV